MDFDIGRHLVNLSANGRLGATGLLHTPPASLQQIFAGLANSGSKRMTIYFHGGVTNEVLGLQLARHLYPEISENCDSYPVFFIWESGVLERIQSTMIDVVESSPLFMRVLKHLTRSLAHLLPRPDPHSPEAVETAWLLQNIEEARLFLDEPATLMLLDSQLGRVQRPFLDPDVIQLQRDLAADSQADRALGAIIAAAQHHASIATSEAAPTTGPQPANGATGYLSQTILDQLLGLQSPAEYAEMEFSSTRLRRLTKPTDWFFVSSLMRKIIERFENGTDHGFLGTILEEMYRNLYADKVGRFLWDGMKEKAAKAYDSIESGASADNTPGGTLFLKLLREHQKQHGPVELNLVGHSAGSIHISHFVDCGVQMDPEQFNVESIIFLAPACNFELFTAKLIPHANRINKLRIFTMSDTYERLDPLIKLMPAVYPHSLLYLVSGLFEDKPDTPLLGLARHLEREGIPLLNEVQDFLELFNPGSVVYSKTTEDAPSGEQANFTSHYGLWGPNLNRATLDSIAYTIRPAAVNELEELVATIPITSPDDANSSDASLTSNWPQPIGLEDSEFYGAGAILEQIIGTDDIVDHAVIDALMRAGRAVARIVAPGFVNFSEVEPAQRRPAWLRAKQSDQLFDGYGTGWILGNARRVLITNNHVLPLPETAAAAAVEFGFERDLRRGVRAKFVTRLRPNELFITDPNMAFGGLDYTVVALSRPAPEEFGYLEPVQGVTAVGASNIFIVQHPGGAGKAYVLTNNHKVSLPQRYVTYISDTLEGSSGSALFDDRVRLVGIHHLGNYVENIGGIAEQVNLGSRIEFVIEDIACKLRAMNDWDEERVRYWFGDGMVLASWRRQA